MVVVIQKPAVQMQIATLLDTLVRTRGRQSVQRLYRLPSAASLEPAPTIDAATWQRVASKATLVACWLSGHGLENMHLSGIRHAAWFSRGDETIWIRQDDVRNGVNMRVRTSHMSDGVEAALNAVITAHDAVPGDRSPVSMVNDVRLIPVGGAALIQGPDAVYALTCEVTNPSAAGGVTLPESSSGDKPKF